MSELNLAVAQDLLGAGIIDTIDEATTLVRRHGEEVLAILKKAVRVGVSKELALEALSLGGTVLLDLLADLRGKQSLFGAGLVEGEEVATLDLKNNLIKQLVKTLVKELLTEENLDGLVDRLLALLLK